MDLQLVLRTLWFSFLWMVAGIAEPACTRISSPLTPAVVGQRGSTADFFWIWSLWVKGFVDKARSVPQWHEQMLIAEGVKDDHFGDRFRE